MASPFTNLTNIFFDKATGEFVLRDISIDTGSFNLVGFVHLQVVESTTWTIVHDLNTENISGVHVIEDSTNDQIFPDNIEVVDVNTIVISFTSAMSGKATLVLFL
jgi:hypothetical protein